MYKFEIKFKKKKNQVRSNQVVVVVGSTAKNKINEGELGDIVMCVRGCGVRGCGACGCV